MKSIIAHFPFEITARPSGTSVRPLNMIQAFKDLGYDVWLVEGPRNKRRSQINDVINAHKSGHPFAFLYGETNTLPSSLSERDHIPRFPNIDSQLYRWAKSHRIPVGVFYRDIYWKFPFYRQHVGLFKAIIARIGFRLELDSFGDTVQTLFLPSVAMARFLPGSLGQRGIALPPGHAIHTPLNIQAPTSVDQLKFLYVGGVASPHYNVTPLLDLAEHSRVTICCRKDEWSQFHTGRKPSTLNIVHESGKALEALYQQHNVFALLREHHEYLEFAMPLKLFEAIGYGLPIITYEGTSVAKFVAELDIGWVYPQNAPIDSGRIVEQWTRKRANICAIADQHTWQRRAQQVDLTLGEHSA